MGPLMNGVSKFITSMTKPDAMAPIIGLEATVTGGRTIQAQKRGGKDEARERLIEESTGAVVWLGGVKFLNYLGDLGLKKLFGANFDVGTDKVLRTPFDNFMKKQPPKKFTGNQVAMMKAGKALFSVLLADAFIGLVVPPLNQQLTRNLSAKKAAEKTNSQDTLEINNKENKNPSFKGAGAMSAINVFTNAIENTNTGKLLSTDAGLVSGRMYSARNNDERREIAIRDIGSIYFYMWAQGHVQNLLNYAESGNFTRLNPTSAETFDKHLAEFLEKNGKEMTVADFKKAVLGKNPAEIELPKGINFEEGDLSAFTKFADKFRKTPTEPLKVITISELEKKHVNDFSKETFDRIKEMSNLQPLRRGEAVVTKQQIIDAINKAEVNDPKLLDKMFVQFTEGASKNEYKFVSNDKLYGLKKEMEQYVEELCKQAKDGKITKEILEKAKKKNMLFCGLNFAAGFAVAALFLSTLIPKFQYWVTKQKTGKDVFPGMYEIEEEQKNQKVS